MKYFLLLLSLVASSFAAEYIGSNYSLQNGVVSIEGPEGQIFVIGGPYGHILSQYQSLVEEAQFTNLLNQIYQKFAQTGLNKSVYNILQALNQQLVQGNLTPQQEEKLIQVENLIQKQLNQVQGVDNQVSYGIVSTKYFPSSQYSAGAHQYQQGWPWNFGYQKPGSSYYGNSGVYQYQQGSPSIVGFDNYVNSFPYKYSPFYTQSSYSPVVAQSSQGPSQWQNVLSSYSPKYGYSVQGGFVGQDYVSPSQVYGGYGVGVAGVSGQVPFGGQKYGVQFGGQSYGVPFGGQYYGVPFGSQSYGVPFGGQHYGLPVAAY